MREIKFRGKGVITNNWFVGSLITIKDGAIIYSDNFLYEGAVKPETIGQYTGLKDKNGKEIYEGDILQVKEFANEALKLQFPFDEIKEFALIECKGSLLQEYKCVISFNDGNVMANIISTDCELYIATFFGDMRYSQPIFEFEIIGNIYDNPKLIKEEEK